MKHIPLTHGKFAIVDDEDYYKLIGYKWVAVHLFSDKYYARNQKHGLMSKYLLKTHPNEDLVVDFANGDTLDYRRSNLIKRKSFIRDPKVELVRKNSQLSLDLSSHNTFNPEDGSIKFTGIFEKVLFEAKHVDPSGRIFNFGTFENREEAQDAYDRNMKMLSE